ncbi:MAG TPA: S9 family peptidase [Bryobacteraceae bacterium]|jgi:dipeptidyl aminopeptidase/acylaminoacyl peptidase|nr:S9 family peptidase [Bryobacteraceae bacterium]
MRLRILSWFFVVTVALHGWTPDDMLRVKSVGDVQVSPDGRSVAFTVTQHNLEISEPISQIWLAHADGTQLFQLTHGMHSSSSPRWSPDGKRVAFLSTRSGVSNIWISTPDGRETGQLTNSKSGVSAFRWSSKGRLIAFTAPTDPTGEEEKRRNAKEDWHVVGTGYAYQRLWVVPVVTNGEDPQSARLITKQNYQLGGAFGGGFMDWSPDDRKIVFAHMPRPRFDDWRKLDIAEVDLESGRIRPVAETPASEDTPLYSPDGKWIAYRRSDIPPGWAIDFRICIVPASGGQTRELAETFNQEPSLIGWASDSRSILVQEALGTTSALYRVPIDGAPVSFYAPGHGNFSGASLNSTRTVIGFSAQDSATPPEAFSLSLSGSKTPRQASNVNADLPKLPLGLTRVIRWKGPGNFDIEGLLTYPADYQKGKRYPLIVISHGGPPGAFAQDFIALPGHYPIAAFASHGYAVLRSNVRGSTGYGKRFRYANYDDWGNGDFHDMMAGVDKVIEMGVADPARLGIAGWSYGGYMTSWAITQTHRFKAASIGAPVTDLASMNGTADMWTFVPDYMHAESWENPEVYIKHSPLYNAKGITTPALIQQGHDDTVVPLGQGEEFYNALQSQGVPVRMVVYPRSNHTPRESKIVLNIMHENLDWFNKYLSPGRRN